MAENTYHKLEQILVCVVWVCLYVGVDLGVQLRASNHNTFSELRHHK